MSTEIQWTDETWNPVTGCSKVSPGCAHCYAEGVANRFWPKKYAHQGDGFVLAANVRLDAKLTERVRQFTDVMCHEDRLDQPLRWKKPRKVFVNSMSDLFHEDVPDAFIDRVFAVMYLADRHTYQVLTKRAGRALSYLNDPALPQRIDEAVLTGQVSGWDSKVCLVQRDGVRGWPLKNVWLGVSVENQHFADERIPLLLQTPAAVRFISAEPLLEEVSFRWMAAWPGSDRGAALKPTPAPSTDHLDGLRLLDWVIVGGESGGGARPFNIEWARAIVQECKTAGVSVFVKQFGARPYEQRVVNGGTFTDPMVGETRLRDSHGGDMSEWPEDLRVREFPAVKTVEA